MYQKYFKRLIDIILSSIGLIVLSWLFLILIIAIKVTSPGPVLFKQKRIGKNRQLFDIYKFRSMRVDAPDVPTHLLSDPDQWITIIGKILRKSSLDELPQMMNILKGNMSIIGPRPALWNQNDLADERDKYNANAVLPGLTGLAQISGRDELPISAKSQLDGKYVSHITLIGDIKIFFKTVSSVLVADGVSEGENENNSKNK